MKRYLSIIFFIISVSLSAFSIGDTLSFTIGNTQITGIIQNISGDTITMDGEIYNMNFGNLNVDDLMLSLSGFSNGEVQIYGYGHVLYTGPDTLDIGGVPVTNIQCYLDSTGFWATGDIDIQGTTVSLNFVMGENGFVSGNAYFSSIVIAGLTITDLYVYLSNEGISGGGYFDYNGNHLYITLYSDGDNIYGTIDRCTITVGGLTIYEFYGKLTQNGIEGGGRIIVQGSYLDFNFLLDDSYAINITEGYLTIHGVRIYNISGSINSSGFAGAGSIELSGSMLNIAFSSSGNDVTISVTDSHIIIENVDIQDLNLQFNSEYGLKGSGKVYISGLNYPPDGMVDVYFSTDLNGDISIGLSNGYVVLDDGHEINNLSGYIDNNGFWGSGTYLGPDGDVSVYFRSDNTGIIYWQVYGNSITIGNIILHHYYVDEFGNAYAWWIISPTDSIYFQISPDSSSATVASPCSFNLGGLTISDFQGTLTNDPDWAFSGSGYVTIGSYPYSVTVPISFSSTPEGKLVGTFSGTIALTDSSGITVNIYGVELTITESGISGKGHLDVNGYEADVEFYAGFDGTLQGTIKNGYFNLGYIVLSDIDMTLSPFTASGIILIPDISGLIGFQLVADGNGGLELQIPAMSFTIDGFQVSGSFSFADSMLVLTGSVSLPGGGSGSIDYLSLTKEGIDSCHISLDHITVSGYTLINGTGIFGRDPDRLIISASFDLSTTGFLDTLYFSSLSLSPDGNILSCEGIGVSGIHISGFTFSGMIEITSNYVILHSASADLSSIGAGNVSVLELVFDRDGNFVSVSAFGITGVNVGVFQGDGWAKFFDDGVSITGMVTLDNIGYFHCINLMLDYDGNILALTKGEADVTIGEYGFYGDVEIPDTDRIYISGDIRVPDFISGSAGGSILLHRVEDGQGILGLGYDVLAGSVSIPGFEISGYQFTGGSFGFDSIGMNGEAEIDIPNIAGFYLTFSIDWDGTFHYAEITTSGLNIPLGETGLVLTGAGGGLYYYDSTDVWEVMLTGTVEDATQTLSIIATLEVYTDGYITGVGHMAIDDYVYGSAGFSIDIPGDSLTASAWIGEDPDEGISTWGCYIRGEAQLMYNWANVEATGIGNIDISIWFINLGADMGFAYNTTWPYIYGPYYMERLYTHGFGAAAILNDYLYGMNVQWNGSGFDFDTWSGSMGNTPGNAPYVHDYLLAGAYPDEGMDWDYLGGEDKVEPYDSYNSIGGKVWFGGQTDSTGFLNLNSYFPDVTSGVCYAHIYIDYHDTTSVWLRYGIVGDYKIFLNGYPVATGQNTYAQPDRDSVLLNLEQGWNRLMIKNRKITGDWGMYLRLTDTDGNEVPFLTCQPDEPDANVTFHDRCYTFNFDNWERTGNVYISNGTIAVNSDGYKLYGTIIRDKNTYNRENYPTIKSEFKLTGTALNDSTIIAVDGYDSNGFYHICGVLYYYENSKGEGVLAPLTSQRIKSKSLEKSINVGEWYTQELVFHPEYINCYIYRAGEERPIVPFFTDSSYNWSPSFFATAGGDDNILYLDNIVVKQEWEKDETVAFSSPHPYPNDTTMEWVIYRKDASAIRIHFSSFSIENYFDSLVVLDGEGNIWCTYNGDMGRFTSCTVPGKKAIVRLITDPANNGYGFDVDFVQYYKDYPVWFNIPENISTEHPYQNNSHQEWTVSYPGARAMRVTFSNFYLEDGHDFVYLYDKNDVLYATYTGHIGNFNSRGIPGDQIKIVFESDNAVQEYGFDIKIAGYVGEDWTGEEKPEITEEYIKPVNTIISDRFNIHLVSMETKTAHIKIYDVTGREILSNEIKVHKGFNIISLSLDRIPSGTYFAVVKSGKNVLRQKFIKIK